MMQNLFSLGIRMIIIASLQWGWELTEIPKVWNALHGKNAKAESSVFPEMGNLVLSISAHFRRKDSIIVSSSDAGRQ
jgi:hypothetical protein